MARKRDIIFRIFYSTSFTIIFLVLIGHTLVAPADAVYQAFKDNRLVNIFMLAGVYVVTAFFCVILYASRLYTNRSILASIPKTYLPVEEGDVGKHVRRVIEDGLAQSAVIAYEANPRTKWVQSLDRPQSSTVDEIEGGVPPWKDIAHPGWTSPASPDLPNLHYRTVVEELPNLIEAKAVSLAPTSTINDTNGIGSPETLTMPDERAVDILQRMDPMGLREYVAHLTNLDLVNPPELGIEFLRIYEKARFSGHELDESEFRSLLSIFAEILRGMSSLHPDLLASLRSDATTPADGGSEEGDIDTYPSEAASSPTDDESSDSQSTSESYHSLGTTPNIPRSNFGYHTPRSTSAVSRRQVSSNSVHRLRSQPSNVSRRSNRSGGSVIRLTEGRGPLDLPYTINLPNDNG
ncbi:MAG: hypothetical protein Q9227_001000 [Pyrenula ochraceoflavens]